MLNVMERLDELDLQIKSISCVSDLSLPLFEKFDLFYQKLEQTWTHNRMFKRQMRLPLNHSLVITLQMELI